MDCFAALAMTGWEAKKRQVGEDIMAALRVITTGLRFPEGPVAMKDGSVVLVEIERGTVTRVKPDGTQEQVARTGGGPNGMAVGPDGAFYVCNNGGFPLHRQPHKPPPVGPPPGHFRGPLQTGRPQNPEGSTL